MSGGLVLEGVNAGYGAVRVLHDVGLTVEEGSITAVVGANGAGKTTLLRTVTGQLRPWAGSIRLGGKDLTRVPVEAMVRQGVALVPEGRGVITELTVDENLRLGGLWRRDRKAAAAVLAEMYTLFEPLARRRKAPGHQLSGGERQMLALGRALMAAPSLLLLDEPSLGLAPKVTAQILGMLRSLRDDTGLTVLLIEQNVRSALAVADHGIILNLGRIVAARPAAELAADTGLRHTYLGF
ncbi:MULTISPECIES: ABC transporter ATP-binding protein [unclassified Arthrobacter]|uniref:ABC transporter ATP-binding protein n=1 Tax=unclassified Arthrobacter TaxID=235627 RepID=UPI001D14E90C|nr:MULTISPECIES: ABC transporter ATP-binding protein [unclassified Arthrobacter]MCC3276915.1 ABC transporter ATP-binding protein [Arthrobacter sp. zg-Y20]MCC3277652.1 ABC transporter ATP-binding protein [Arthrobacter sp. zg-Y40]MCC9176057.1 ABC transporter ATP-binding protein [Arthrobacter sp. zg-Y750]MDK1317076.1 ABC transporter ATP-binding protein [Arthrobacter sp. zg.Y20]MDK1327252.1 ABC transporter ATP-binding protein [Arthrobacter sp. zg-Y1143]